MIIFVCLGISCENFRTRPKTSFAVNHPFILSTTSRNNDFFIFWSLSNILNMSSDVKTSITNDVNHDNYKSKDKLLCVKDCNYLHCLVKTIFLSKFWHDINMIPAVFVLVVYYCCQWLLYTASTWYLLKWNRIAFICYECWMCFQLLLGWMKNLKHLQVFESFNLMPNRLFLLRNMNSRCEFFVFSIDSNLKSYTAVVDVNERRSRFEFTLSLRNCVTAIFFVLNTDKP